MHTWSWSVPAWDEHRVGRAVQRGPRNLGPDAMNFDWGDHRKVRWVRLCAAMLGDEDHARALTALVNLSGQHATDERTISEADLEAGWRKRI